MDLLVIGIDCAVGPQNVGLARGSWAGGQMRVEEATRGSSRMRPAVIVEEWISRVRDTPVLLALDAPLGWPVPLAQTMIRDRAGEPLRVAAHTLFRRRTDVFVREHIGLQSLDVGADRIPRTAHAALELLQTLRTKLDLRIPLAWGTPVTGVAAIEVYPAATLVSHRIERHAYKHAKGAEDRSRILAALDRRMHFSETVVGRAWASDEVDAIVCLLAARDFLVGASYSPPDLESSEREGWIWVRCRAVERNT